jgi:predicted GNAT family N-acyltransferase
MTTDFEVSWADWQVERESLVAVRYRVFVDEQQVPQEIELDEMDASCRHVKALDAGGRCIGTARLLPNHFVGRMCVLRERRGQGVASAMMHFLIDHATREGFAWLRLNAQVSAIPFYQRFGFVADSAVFTEAGIDHRRMTLKLAEEQD